MRRIMLAARLAAVALLAGAGTLPAQAQEPAAPASPPAGEAKPPELSKNETMAARLAGLVGFVNVACAELRGEPEQLKAALRRLGIEPGALDGGTLHLAATAYLESYRKDPEANCKRAFDGFGPEGKLVPNLVLRR
ncbi:hypothetical protein [Methylobacterium radiodurans]|uniref:Uncharacterized protein n=1 Tax=Methylobacterium radiodurans TaxID=2202828 RepID=A0A2U8VV22_9HYPH|nr:hypothetical protein [Methylobacterium radiodurans]AWN36986.1 hypothetical protein DK427_15620 [Methylobacterium radiodurans]